MEEKAKIKIEKQAEYVLKLAANVDVENVRMYAQVVRQSFTNDQPDKKGLAPTTMEVYTSIEDFARSITEELKDVIDNELYDHERTDQIRVTLSFAYMQEDRPMNA